MLAVTLAIMELKHQTKGPILRVVASISLLMVVGSAMIDALRLEAMSDLGSGPGLVVRVHLIWSLFYLFTAAAMVGEAVTRDARTGFAPLVRATPATRSAYLLGRFSGATAGVLLCFLTVPLGLIIARLLPGAHPDWVAPVHPSTFAFALFGLAIPNLLVASAFFLALATATRSMNGCLIGAVALLSLYGLGSGGTDAGIMFEPFGFAAAEAWRDGFPMVLVANRLLWLAAAALAVVAAVRLDTRTPLGRRSRKPLTPSVIAPTPQGSDTYPGPRPVLGAAAALPQLRVRLRHHLREVMLTPSFSILLVLGSVSCLAAVWPEVAAGKPVESLIATLIHAFTLVPVVVALFFAGEIHWSDTAHRFAPILHSYPVPRAILLLAQILSLSLVLLVLALVTGAVLVLAFAASGRPPAIATVLTHYALPKAYDWALLGILAWCLQTISPNKFAGWGFFVLFLIVTLALDQAGLSEPMLHYGRYPGAPLPPEISGQTSADTYRIIWGGVAILILAASIFAPLRTSRKR